MTTIVLPRGEKLMAFSSTLCSDRLEHALAGAHDDALVEPADQADVRAGENLAEVTLGVADQLREVGRQARCVDQFGRADVVALGGDHEVEQARQRGIDDLEGAPGPRIVLRHGATHRLEGRPDGGQRRLEGVRLVLGGLADLLRDAPQVVHQLVEVAGDARQLGHDVAVREGIVADAALADLGGDIAKAPQAETDADGDQERQHGEHEVDGRGDADLPRLPVGPADRGVEEFGGACASRSAPSSRRRRGSG